MLNTNLMNVYKHKQYTLLIRHHLLLMAVLELLMGQ